MDQVIVIVCGEDGDVSMYALTEGDFLEKLRRHDFGDPPQFLNLAQNCSDLSQKAGIYVIKGKLVIPTPVQVVTEYKL